MATSTFNQQLLDFIQASPTPFHAVQAMRAELLDQGFTELHEADAWKLQNGGKYFVSRTDS